MHSFATIFPLLAIFNLGSGEVFVCLAVVLILFGARRIPELARGMRTGLKEFRDATDEIARDSGRSVGGIYGKPAAEAITPDNQVAELYKTAALDNDELPPGPIHRHLEKLSAKGSKLIRRWLVWLIGRGGN